MANNLAQRELREKQSPKGNLLKGIAVGGAISDKESKMMKIKRMGAISDKESKMMTDTGWMKAKKVARGVGAVLKATNPVAMMAIKGAKAVGRGILNQVDKDIQFKRKVSQDKLKK